MYRWFCPVDGNVLDPFAGGCTRGIVAATLGLNYIGIEIRKPQVVTNISQSKNIPTKSNPKWIIGDSRDVLKLVEKEWEADFFFSCPPYFNLEVYSTDEKDISNIEHYDDFIVEYTKIIKTGISKLKMNRFACFVVSNVRKNNGVMMLRPLVSDTITAFTSIKNVYLWNDIILQNGIGGKRFTTRRHYLAGHKLATVHQHVLVFVKGNPKECPTTIQKHILQNGSKTDYLQELLTAMENQEESEEREDTSESDDETVSLEDIRNDGSVEENSEDSK